MAKGVLVVFTTPAEGREADFNKWYDEEHVPQVLALPGFLSAARYRVSERQLGDAVPPGPYLAVYEIEGDDLGQVVGAIRRGYEEGSITRSDAAAPGGTLLVFDEVLARQEAAPG